MIRALRLRARRGQRYDGPAAYADECDGKPIIRSYYALTPDGKRLQRPLVRLVSVDDAPDDAEDGACHYEIAGKRDFPSRPSRIVPLELHAQGRGRLRT